MGKSGDDGCSTPFGITEVGTRDGRSKDLNGAVLNAFRHHRGRHAFAFTRHPMQVSGAQRLSASQRSARVKAQSEPAPRLVLNAFRHHRGRHFPIIEDTGFMFKCSTPFGITEVGTRRGTRDAPRQPVLNAFRHHRGRHESCVRVHVGNLSVLNAFRHHRGRHNKRVALRTTAPPSAQRLSASQRSARFLSRRKRLPITVLNAFRHHRGRHSTVRERTPAQWSCSTPFGITEVGTGVYSKTGEEVGQCSTPFGITEVGTRLRKRTGMGKEGAQRLSASQRSAPLSFAASSAFERGAQRLSASQRSAHETRGFHRLSSIVLNAFRHHRGRHSCAKTDNPGS